MECQDCKSRTLPIYLKSEFESTKRELAKMTPDQLQLADAIYYEAEKSYEQGGHWIVEASTPWEAVAEFKSVAHAEEAWKTIQDYADDIRGA